MTKANVEIERKFLVNKELLPKLEFGVRFGQGYMSETPNVRVRVAQSAAWITVKGPGKLSRKEFEYEVPVADAEEILGMCQSKLEKTRFVVRHERHKWEVDKFHGSLDGLWLAEVELSSEDEQFGRPPWIGEEVTMDGRYSNASLAKNGLPKPE